MSREDATPHPSPSTAGRPLDAPAPQADGPPCPGRAAPGQLPVAVVVVDHGSRREESNRQLLQVAEQLRRRHVYAIVEAAHMELAEPSIQTAIDRAVQQGARRIVVFPFLLFEGRHWHQDIPRLARQAIDRHPGVALHVADPLGTDERLLDIVQDRVAAAWDAAGWRDEP